MFRPVYVRVGPGHVLSHPSLETKDHIRPKPEMGLKCPA